MAIEKSVPHTITRDIRGKLQTWWRRANWRSSPATEHAAIMRAVTLTLAPPAAVIVIVLSARARSHGEYRGTVTFHDEELRVAMTAEDSKFARRNFGLHFSLRTMTLKIVEINWCPC